MIVPVKDSFSMLRPPIDRTMRVLERSFFKQKFALAAARIFDNSNIHPLRKKLGEDVLQADRISSVRPSPILEDVPLTRKAILLRPDIKADEPETWSSTLSQLVEQKILAVTPFELVLDYDYWNYGTLQRKLIMAAEVSRADANQTTSCSQSYPRTNNTKSPAGLLLSAMLVSLITGKAFCHVLTC